MVTQLIKIFPTIYWKYGLLQTSLQCHSRLSWSMNCQNPSSYSSLKPISILSSYIHTSLLNGLFPPHFPNKNPVQDYLHSHACHIPNPFCHCSLIPYYLTSSTNYETLHYASFSSQFLFLQFKHYSHHSVLKQPAYKWQKTLHNLTSPFLCYSFHAFSYNLYFNQQNELIKKQ